MRRIEKGPAPATVTSTERASTTNLTTIANARTAYGQLEKSAVRAQLATEQRHLCAFCMRRFDANAVDARGQPIAKIAHRVPLSVAPLRALDWKNLLGSCDGGQRSSGHHRTCDLAQGDVSLTVDPTELVSMSKLFYKRRDGRRGLFLTSEDADLRRDVEETLRLNDGDLPGARESVWEAFLVRMKKRTPNQYGKPARRAFLRIEAASHGEKLPEWFGVLEKMVGLF